MSDYADEIAELWETPTLNQDPGLVAFARKCFAEGFRAGREDDPVHCCMCRERVEYFTFTDGKFYCNSCYLTRMILDA